MSLLKLSFKKMHPNAIIPIAKSNGDIGMDVYSVEEIIVPAGQTRMIDTGLCIANIYLSNLDTGLSALVKIESRSGMASKGLFCSGGIIDLGYTGNIKVALNNHSDKEYKVNIGDRICQLVCYSVFSNTSDISNQCIGNPNNSTLIVEETDEVFERGNRGTSGFGASGI